MKKSKAYFTMMLKFFLLFPMTIVLGAGSAFAQSDTGAAKSSSVSDIQLLEEVVVTATRRTESIMDVPFSVNVLEESDIQRLNNFNLEDLSRNIAGLNIQNLGPGQTVVNHPRGVVRPDRPRPARHQGTGGRLPGRHADCDLAVHAGPGSL